MFSAGIENANRNSPPGYRELGYTFRGNPVVVVVKIAPIGTRTRNFHSRVRRSAGLSIPGRDIDFMSCSVFICALRSFYSALNSISLPSPLPKQCPHCFVTGDYEVYDLAA